MAFRGHVQSHISGECPEMAAHCGALVIRSSLSLKPVSTVPFEGLEGWRRYGLAEHAVGS